MECDLGVQGIEELVQKLEGISTTIDRQTNRILRESAEPLKEELKRNTPTHTPLPTRPTKGHAKDHIINSNVKRRDGEKYVEVGYDGDYGWYMWFLEKGTYSLGEPKGIKPRHHVEQSFQNSKVEIGLAQVNQLRRLIAKVGK